MKVPKRTDYKVEQAVIRESWRDRRSKENNARVMELFKQIEQEEVSEQVGQPLIN